MTIDEAIAELEKRKQEGVESVLISWWEADKFGLSDDINWRHAAEETEAVMDWTVTHGRLSALVRHYIDKLEAAKRANNDEN